MLFKNLVVAINSLASSLHDLASAIRGQQPTPVMSETQVREWITAKTGIEVRKPASDNSQTAPQPTSNVIYNSEYEEEREREAEEMREYLATREFRPLDGGKEVKSSVIYEHEQEN